MTRPDDRLRELTRFDGTFVRGTEKGIQIRIGRRKIWFTRKHVELRPARPVAGDAVDLWLPDWLMSDRGLEAPKTDDDDLIED